MGVFVHFIKLKSNCFVVIILMYLHDSGYLVADEEEKKKVCVGVCVWVRERDRER